VPKWAWQSASRYVPCPYTRQLSPNLLTRASNDFPEVMQRIFEYGDIQNTSRTPDKELNILIY